MSDCKKILVIRFSSLGDIILTLPFIKILKRKFLNSEIDYITKFSYSDILKNNPAIHEILIADDGLDFKVLRKLRKILKYNNYDLIVDLHNNLRTFYLKLFLRSGAKVISFRKYTFRKFLLVKFKLNLMRELPPICMRFIQTLKQISGISFDNSEIDLYNNIFTCPQSAQIVESILIENKIPTNAKLICIIPGSKHFTKTYPAECYAELINKFDKTKYSVILVGAGNDKAIIDSITSHCSDNIFDFCDKLNLLELTELFRKCHMVIGGDTGPIHIAEALNVPLIMLAGSSVKEFGFYPQSDKAIVIENNNLKCRPCSHIGRDSCPKRHFKCMKEITCEMVWESLSPSLPEGEGDRR